MDYERVGERSAGEIAMSAPSATGNLASTPFCELLVYALSQELSGSLVLECPDRSKHALLFTSGIPAKARVAHAGTRLGQVLIQIGAATEDAVRLALEGDSEELLGQRLYARGALEPDDLARGLWEQLMRQLSWLSGAPPQTAFAYYAGADLLEDWGGEAVRVDPLAAIWRAVEAQAPKDRVAAALQGLGDKKLRLHPDSRIARFDFSSRVRGLLDVLKVKPQSLAALESTRLLDTPTLHKLLYALTLTRHLDIGVAPLGVTPGMPWVDMTPRRRASTAGMPAASQSQVGPAVRSGQSQVGPAVRSGQSQIGPAVRSGQSQTGPKVSMPRPPGAAAGVDAAPPSALRAPLERPVVERAAIERPAVERPVVERPAAARPAAHAPRPPAVGAGPVPAQRAASDALQTGRFLTREEIESKLAEVDALNHYELLELPLGAPEDQVSRAFPALARRWHPDRLSPELTELREGVTRVFARMTEANRVLSNPGTRKAYDESLGTPDAEQQEQEQIAQVLRSAEAFQKAEILLKKRDLEGAETLARTAHEGDPDQPEYAALYAFIRARRPDASEQDIMTSLAMLKKAIGKQTNNVKIHYYLACLLKAAGQTSAAMREYRHVAENDPSNVDAAREIRLHEMRKGQSKQPPADAGLLGKFFKR